MLYVFVEGPDDKAYFSKIFGAVWGDYTIIQYASLKKDKIKGFIQSIGCIPNADYLFFGDADGRGIGEAKASLLSTFPYLVGEKIIIVQYEIESWYYAGASEDVCKKLKIKHFVHNTDSITKEQFESKLVRPAEKRYVMACILDQYLLALATTRNTSLSVFASSI